MHSEIVSFTPRFASRRCSVVVVGFTLVEMLVTCALVAVLMLAVTQVFSIASRTMGGGQALGAAVRDAQAAQAVFVRDLSAAAGPTIGPYFYITSSRVSAARNLNDANGDRDGNLLTFDFNGDGDETDPEDRISQASYNFRNHRIDTLSFFAIDRYTRQTGNNNSLVISDAAREACIWYGHVNLANNNATSYYAPGAADNSATDKNDNNRYASQWALGRVAMLIKDSPTAADGFVARNAVATPDLTPLAFRNTSGAASPNLTFRYDVAQTSIARYRSDLIDAINAGANWVNSCVFGDAGGTVVGRYQVNPYQLRPLTAAAAAQQVPIFVPACTQFIVEFAGDFVQQNPTTGAYEDTDSPPDGNFVGQDGRIDTVPGTNQIRWYGLPRDTNGNGILTAADGDVVPVRDLAGPQTFEHSLPTTSVPTATAGYLDPSITSINRYIAAWGPGDQNRPKMIRITLVIDRPEAEGKLFDGQSFEYVFNVGY